MSDNILSYCLFDPLNMHTHRTWDKNRLESDRYWYNIPAVLIANEILYPKFKTKFYITPNLKYNPLFAIIESSGAEIQEVDLSFKETSEPMLWRMMPLWEDVSCFFTRDIDSIPNREEAQCSLFFHNNDYHIQTIRSHENHYHEQGCDMLGGLSGFKPKLISNKPKTFLDYYNSKNDMPWAQDQYLMVNTFVYSQNQQYMKDKFLDCPINNQNRSAKFPCSQISKEQKESIVFTELQNRLLKIIEDNQMSVWAGEPCDARGKFLKEILSLPTNVGERIRKSFDANETLEYFYGVNDENLSKQILSQG